MGMALLACCAFAIMGCEEEVTAVLGSERAFSLYGVLSPQLDTQWVRVFPVVDRLEPAADEPLGAILVSTDLETGEEYEWSDSIITDAFGQRAHVYWAPFAAEYDHSYRLRVRGTDGAEASVVVSVPPRTEVVVQEADVDALTAVIPVLIQGDAPRLIRVEVEYSVAYRAAGDANPSSAAVVIPYPEASYSTQDGWVVPIDLDAAFVAVSDSLVSRIDRPIDRNYGVYLNFTTLHLIVANEEWNPPGGSFDPNVLVQPGTLSNVENGFGFVGAGYRHEHEWIPDNSAARAAGFRVSVEAGAGTSKRSTAAARRKWAPLGGYFGYRK